MNARNGVTNLPTLHVVSFALNYPENHYAGNTTKKDRSKSTESWIDKRDHKQDMKVEASPVAGSAESNFRPNVFLSRQHLRRIIFAQQARRSKNQQRIEDIKENFVRKQKAIIASRIFHQPEYRSYKDQNAHDIQNRNQKPPSSTLLVLLGIHHGGRRSLVHSYVKHRCCENK